MQRSIEGTNYGDEEDWDELTETLTYMMRNMTTGRRYPDMWKAQVNGFGWRNLNGIKTFKAVNGAQLLQKVLPETECSFSISIDTRKKTISINNAHHDKPTGGEIYTIRPMTIKEVETRDM